MNESGDRLDAAYRAIAREEPRAAIDDAILAASRRAVAKPSAARRWAAPVSIAAVLVLAFGVTLHMQQESPGIASPDLATAPPPAAATTAAPEPAAPAQTQPLPQRQGERRLESAVAKKPVAPPPPAKLNVQAKPDREQPRAMEERDRGFRDDVSPAPERKDLKAKVAPAEPSVLHKETAAMQVPVPQAPPAPAARAAAPASAYSAPSPAAPAAAASAPAAIGEMRLKRETANQAPAAFAADAQAADEFARDLEAIAKLRAEGRHEEADKALEEFRRKHPGYRIPDAMWERVKPR
jgi:hypothetical protein